MYFSDSSLKNLAIPYANGHRARRGWRIHYPRVESRMFLWSRSGAGQVTINGSMFEISPMDYFVIPWGHEIEYRADDVNPYVLAGIHLIPWHDPDVDWVWQVAHKKGSDLFGSPHRRDLAIEGLEGLLHFQLSPGHRLYHLSEYVVRHSQSFDCNVDILRSCGHALVAEAQSAAKTSGAIPPKLKQLRQYVGRNLSQRLSVEDLAMRLGRSLSQINRLCNQYFGCSPGEWITRLKVTYACDRLLQTQLSIAEIAREVGFDDQFYFSRLFKKHMGMSPLKYRQRQPLI